MMKTKDMTQLLWIHPRMKKCLLFQIIASAMVLIQAKAEIKKRMNVDEVIIIPSSIQECIVVPHTDEMSMDDIARMIQEVNANEVAEEDILSDAPIAMAI